MSVSTLRPLIYVYPMFKEISFRFIGDKHIKQLQKYIIVRAYDESTLPTILPIIKLLYTTPVILHPFFFQVQHYGHMIDSNVSIIGIDVADTNHLTEKAVEMTEKATALIVPSTFAQKAFTSSGVKTPTHVIPHGVEENWITAPKQKITTFSELGKLKKEGIKIIQSWILHSDYRKGQDLLIKIWNELMDERKDTALALRKQEGIQIYTTKIIEGTKPTTIPIGWLSEQQKMELMDVCDIYLLTSRGGGFEHPPLEALSRGEIVIGAEGGAWQDFLPDWLLVKSHESGQIFMGNPIHDGAGVEMEIEDAINKLHNILNDLEEYRAKVYAYVNTHIREKFTWEKVGKQLANLIAKYM